MRISFLQIFIISSLIGSSWAKSMHAQDVLSKKITINQVGVTVSSVLKKLETDYSVNFVYSPQVLDPKLRVDVSGQAKALSDVLNDLLSPVGLTYEASDDVIAIRRVSQTTDETVVAVSGKVVDEKTNEPLPGVTVKIKGTNTATTTDVNGIYNITVPDGNAVLVFTFIGFEPQEATPGTRKIVNVALKTVQNNLSDVVVVGYGTQKRQYVTGAVASANLEAFKDAPNTNIAQSLQGTVPGLNVGPVTVAGSTPSITIRGRNSISGNQSVLIILDGIQYNSSLSSINPDDIASIDILKDASSTAVYGAQAANGVILITSRKGNKNSKPRINLSTSYATQNPSGNIHPMERDEYLQHVRDLYYTTAYLAPDYTTPNPAFNLATAVDASQRENGNLVATDYDWWKAGTKRGFINDNQVSISGGAEKISYLLSGAFTNQAGYVVNDLFKRKTLRSNVEVEALKGVKVGLQAFGSFVNADGAEPTLADLFQQAPLNSPYNADGSLKPQPFNTTGTNPFLTYVTDDYERHNYLFANLYTQIDFPWVKGLSYRVNFGNNYREDKRYNANPFGAGLSGSAYKNNEQYSDYVIDNILTYNRTFNDHSVTATLLYGASERKYDFQEAAANGFTRLNLSYNNLSLGATQFARSNAYREALNYQMARVSYAYKGRYLATATVRRDGYSAFAANNKYAVFPSGSLGWVFSEENFGKVSWLDYGKLRVGYGTSGNQTIRYYSLDRVTTQQAYVFGDGGTPVSGQFVGTLANPNLKWERTMELNIGVDFTVLKGRLSGNVDYYDRHTKDLLFSVQIPNITGYDAINTNVGEMGNKGVEVSLTSKNLVKKDFGWTSTVAFSRNVNKIISLLGTGDLITSNLFIGQPFGAVYNYRLNGIYQVGETPPAGFFRGNLRILDANGDGRYTTDDRAILGSTDPAYRFSVLNTFRYKKLSLSVFLNSIQGGTNGYLGDNTQSQRLDDNNIRWNRISGIDFWTPSNPNGIYPNYTTAPALTAAQFFSRSFVRLQDVTLAYQLDNKFTKRLGINGFSIYASGKNLHTWTNWKGWDPEIANGGLSINGRPLLTGYSLGINVTL